jgi:hypothetical protein
MPQPGLETKQKLAQIEAERARLKGILTRQQDLLKLIEEKGIPDSQPYISFKKAKDVKDLAGQPGGLRKAIRDEILLVKRSLDLLLKEAKDIRRHGYQEFVRRERAAVHRIDRKFEAEVTRVLRNASARGHLTDEELAGLQEGADDILDAYTDLLRLDNSERAMRDVLNQIADTMVLGGGDPKVSQRAMLGLTNAGKENLEKAKRKLGQAPSNKNARELIRAATNLEMLGDDSATAGALRQTLAWVESEKDKAEKRFRSVPSTENLRAMLMAEITCVEMGGTQIKNPPNGLKRVKTGTQHTIANGDTLSGISRAYYGSFSFWDVLVRANAELWKTPDRPPTGVIAIPF